WSFIPTGSLAVSPDGRDLAFVALSAQRKTALWVRPIGSLAARVLPDTEGASFPFWSPDGRFIAFFANGKLRKIDSSGGASQTICEAPIGRGGSWNRDGVIVFAPRNRTALYRVPAGGGEPEPLTKFEGEEGSHRWPVFLPDGRHFLFVALGGSSYGGLGKIFGGSLDSKERRQVASAASNVAYVPPGYLLFFREGNLLAQPFDAGRQKTRGEPVLLADQVSYTGSIIHADFTASEQGVVLYRNSTLVPHGSSGGDLRERRPGRSERPATIGGRGCRRMERGSPWSSSIPARNRGTSGCTEPGARRPRGSRRPASEFGGRRSGLPTASASPTSTGASCAS